MKQLRAYEASIEKARRPKKLKVYTKAETLRLLDQCEKAIQSVQAELEEGRSLCALAGLPAASETSTFIKQKHSGNSVADALTANP